jgi:hypothetical protein
LSISALNDEVSSLNVAELPEAREQGIVEFFVPVRYETDPPNPGALLGAQSERPSHDCADPNCAETTN